MDKDTRESPGFSKDKRRFARVAVVTSGDPGYLGYPGFARVLRHG